MPKNSTQESLPKEIVEIKTSINYRDEIVEAAVRINVNDLASIAASKGSKAVNEALKNVVTSLYDKTNENLKNAINK